MQTNLATPEISRHKCLIYDGDATQQLPVVVPFLKEGLLNNWRCLYLGKPETLLMLEGALRKAGIDTTAEMKRGALLFSSERHHLMNGAFDARAMVSGLSDLIDGAVQEGFRGLCATGDMKWELGPEKNFDRLVEYEALLEQLFREKPLLGLCQYHRAVIPARTIRDALLTHRCTYIGDTLNRDNLFYMPPEVLLEGPDEEPGLKQGEWMCQQIMRVLKAEQARDEALAALEDMNRDLERRVKERTSELEMANEQLDAFCSAVSHDLRAPLKAISGFSYILAKEEGPALSDDGRTHLEYVRSSVRYMGELIEGLLTLARVTKANLNPASVDLTALARDVEREIRASEPNRSAQIVIHDNMRVLGDKVLLRCVLANLIGNAWKFTGRREQANIEVGARLSESGTPVYFVKDNGAGFEMRYVSKLFNPFERLHRQEEFPGTGVGLSTVQKIIEKHSGHIWAESQPDHGAIFYFTLSDGTVSGQLAISQT